MFGYVMVNKQKLSEEENDTYLGFYCGLCDCLHQTYGRSGQMALNFDMTFLAILLSGLYECEITSKEYRCPFHPTKKRNLFHNVMIEYASDMTILLTYLKCEDNWEDERKKSSYIYQKALKKKFLQVQAKYPDKVKKIREVLEKTHLLEEEKCEDIDALAGLSGVMLGEILAYREDEWKGLLYEMGDYLGRFIYIMDAYEDVEKDISKNCFNPFIKSYQKCGFDERIKNILELMIARSSDAFEKLPILEYANILRNIIYSGVWARYEMVRKKREDDKDGRSV